MNLKKKIILTTILTIAIAILACIIGSPEVKAATQTVDGITWYYEISSGKAVNVYVSSGTPGETFTIPDKLGGYPVTSIRGYSTNTTSTSYTYRKNILNTYSVNTTVKKIVIPSTVTSIGANTFANFYYVEEITSGENSQLTSVGGYAFYECRYLKTINFPNASISVGNRTFAECVMLKEFNIEEVTSLGDYAFYNCINIKKVKLANTITKIPSLAFYNCVSIENLDFLPENLTTIEGQAFNRCSGIKSITFPNTLTTIGINAFQTCGSLESLTLPSSLTSIGNYAFAGCSKIEGEVVIPNSVTSLGTNVFSECRKISKVKIGTGLTTIPDYTFNECSNIEEVVIPSTVTSIGNYAFNNCMKLSKLEIPTSVTSIGNQAFSNCVGFDKLVIPASVASVGSQAFSGLKDVWIRNTPEILSVDAKTISSSTAPVKIHWLNDKHQIKITTIPGIRIVNAETSQEMSTADYDCETSLSYKIEVDNPENYDTLKFAIITKNTNGDSAEVLDVDTSKVYEINRLLRDKEIVIQNISNKLDLNLKAFISEKNRSGVVSRAPTVTFLNGKVDITKNQNDAVNVVNGDKLSYKIRVYNESSVAGTANRINVHIPEGLEYVEDDLLNEQYGWKKEGNNVIYTTYLADKEVAPNPANGTLSYQEIEILLKVTGDVTNAESKSLPVYFEIAESSNEDLDSVPDSIRNNGYNSEEDDEDSNVAVIQGLQAFNYVLKINKIDGATSELLNGAEFELQDENRNVIKTGVTANNGVLDFGTLTTYGTGTDIYYIRETKLPEGYWSFEKCTIKAIITKTLTVGANSTPSISAKYELLEYEIDTSRYDFVPVYTLEQLTKIASNEPVVVDGVTYYYSQGTNYKLMADIDATSINWTPINNAFYGMLDGNGHTVKIRYYPTTSITTNEMGLFRYIGSGVVENLNLDVYFVVQSLNTTTTVNGTNAYTPYYGVGGIAGVMQNGYIVNCTVSGTIQSRYSNLGGFVGHTVGGGIVKFLNCKNEASITQNSAWNAGGMVGTALGVIIAENCENNAQVVSNGGGFTSNVGGIAGYVYSAAGAQNIVKADLNKETNTITFAVTNNQFKDTYDLYLETVDVETLNLLPGAIYSVYGRDKQTVTNYENIELTDGRLKIGTFNINSLGADTYYIKEKETVSGYTKLDGVIKVQVNKVWDDEIDNYKLNIETEMLTEGEYEIDVPVESTLPNSSQTGNMLSTASFANVSYYTNRSEFRKCSNYGNNSGTNYNVAGILGEARCIVRFEDCHNYGDITGRKVGGIASGVFAWPIYGTESVDVINCTNTGKILNTGTYSEAGGIVGHALCYMKFSDCTNIGEVRLSSGYGGVAGILANGCGVITFDRCANKGNLYSSGGSGSDVNGGGMIAKNFTHYSTYSGWLSSSMNVSASQTDNILTIKNCTNTGDIIVGGHIGGMVGYTTCYVLTIDNCKTEHALIHDTTGSKGGIVGKVGSYVVNITNCEVDHVDLDRTSSVYADAYGATGGIVGEYATESDGMGSSSAQQMVISDCKATNSDMRALGKEPGGILGYTRNASVVTVRDCSVKNCAMKNYLISGTPYDEAGGIVGATYSCNYVTISDSRMDNSYVEQVEAYSSYIRGDGKVGGAVGLIYGSKVANLENIFITNSSLANYIPGGSGANEGGIAGAIVSSFDQQTIISNCHVDGTELYAQNGTAGGIAGIDFKSSRFNSN